MAPDLRAELQRGQSAETDSLQLAALSGFPFCVNYLHSGCSGFLPEPLVR